ncbi:MAG: hypothetical protein CFH37_01496 [Alphaproteobacteria bacterium MarineAlpha9_Bin7]|nr:MAG: hypothetical protein CFH37_01496 [Alphaproteobacteria bacterium MarineAlpha9_Bin7]
MAAFWPKRYVDTAFYAEQSVPELDLKSFQLGQKGLHRWEKFLTLQHIA